MVHVRTFKNNGIPAKLHVCTLAQRKAQFFKSLRVRIFARREIQNRQSSGNLLDIAG